MIPGDDEFKEIETNNLNADIEATANSVDNTPVQQEVKAETVEEVVNFDSEANRIIMVARLGSLFGCDKKMINA